MTDTSAPRLHLNTSRGSLWSDGWPSSGLNRTAAPYADSASYRGTKGGGGENGYEGLRHTFTGALNSNNSTSLTNNTSNGDWLRESRAGGLDASAAAEPLSPLPRVSELAVGWGGVRQRYADPKPANSSGDYAGVRSGSDSFSRGTRGPSAARPLFASFSNSLPRDKNVIVGDTGRATWMGSAGDVPQGFYSRYGPRAGSPGNAVGPARWRLRFRDSAPPPAASAGFSSAYIAASLGAVPFNRRDHCGDGPVDWVGDARSDSRVAGLVNSRSRARADRWTDDEWWGGVANTAMSTRTDVETTTTTGSSSSSFEDERRHRSWRHRHHRREPDHRRSHGGGKGRDTGDREDTSYVDSDTDSDRISDGVEDDLLSLASAIVYDMDSKPVVPLDLLRNAQETPFMWDRHPSHGVVLCLLQRRGIYPQRYRELVEYHMAELFLHYLDLCRKGAFFVHYSAGKFPKERFLRICMLPVNLRDAASKLMPYLVITFHEGGVRILDSIPLDKLVGITVTPQTACFRPFLESPSTLIGCRGGLGHRTRLPVDGAFSLWFKHAPKNVPRSVDILTCDARVFDIWTKTFRGLLSVNSSSIVQVGLTPNKESGVSSERVQSTGQ
ncbi:hypothetical protein JKF63_02252 [Porcisia hertigi]|uniref:PH-like domain-containing protein n=1 Tax=Porcisia hertigi TaxID=2761500 RepID=A0A836HZ55_9TRYP|nr:hypothetical protein JKF63_02252 [Porcisia hertigi]